LKVYVVINNDWDGGDIHEVFATRELAEEYARRVPAEKARCEAALAAWWVRQRKREAAGSHHHGDDVMPFNPYLPAHPQVEEYEVSTTLPF
jgi:hypothetical protein